MKTLFLLRHAKAEAGSPGVEDSKRALTDSGRAQAQTVGQFASQQKLNFELVLSSPALRAAQTVQLVLQAASPAGGVCYDDRIYDASLAILVEVISAIPDDINSVLVVGHNPGLEEFLRLLTNRAEHMSTATLAQISSEVETWANIIGSGATLDRLVQPKEPGRG
jgi:phosphohistidine phosphatase